MKTLDTLALVLVATLLTIGCGQSTEQADLEVVEISIDHYMEPCRVPFADWCHRVDEGAGFAPTPHCVSGLDQYEWGTQYRVRAERRELDTGMLADARCNTEYAVIEVLSATPAPADTVFTLPGMDRLFLENLETPAAVTLGGLREGMPAVPVTVKESQAALIERLGTKTFDLKVSYGAERDRLATAEIIGIDGGCDNGELALGISILCGDPCYCAEFQPEEEGPTCNEAGQIVCNGDRWGPEGGIVSDCADWGDEGFSDCSE